MASFVWYYYDPEMMLYHGIICVLVWYEIMKLCQYQGDLGHHSGSAPRQAYGPSPGDLDADNDWDTPNDTGNGDDCNYRFSHIKLPMVRTEHWWRWRRINGDAIIASLQRSSHIVLAPVKKLSNICLISPSKRGPYWKEMLTGRKHKRNLLCFYFNFSLRLHQ